MASLRFSPFRVFAFAATIALAVGAASIPARAEMASRIDVNWTDPSDFSEVKENPGFGVGTEAPEAWLSGLARHLQRRAARLLTPDEYLDVTFTDVKLAGSFEPWRGPRWDDVRIVKDIYPPRIDLHFTLRNAAGSTLREGTRELRDPAFLSRGMLNGNDPLRFEKRMLDDWLRRDFPSANAGRN